jgi:hypothetical protein
MNLICYQYLQSHPELANFVRYHPMWYRYLSRDPQRVYELVDEAKVFYGKTFPQRLERLNNQVQMVNMLIQFATAMKD